MVAAASMAELLPPGFKFDPADDVLVAHYLLPRLRGQPLPCDGVVVEADPLSAPPWELLGMYGRKNDAFFFAAGKAKSITDSRQQRTCSGGGCWKGQKKKKPDGVGGQKLLVPGTGEVIAWRKYALNFHADGEQGSTGWVMDEYAITAPADLASSSSIMAYHVRFTGHGKNSKKRKIMEEPEPEPQDWVAGDDAGTPLPPLEHYTTVTPSMQSGSSCVMDSAAHQFQESTHDHEPLFLVDDFTNLAEEMSSWGAVELDEILQFIGETPEPASSSCA